MNYKELWDKLGDISIDSEENIEQPFLDFEVGTDRESIWSWFEDTYNISVGKLMYGVEE